MSDQDLESLMKEMEFDTPLRNRVEEGNQSPVERKVLISETSLTSARSMRNYGEKKFYSETPMTNIGAETEELVPYISGTSDDISDSKKYKLFIVDEPLQLCGSVMGQGITFCSGYNCQTKHRGVQQILKLQEDNIYVAQSKNRAFLSPTMSTSKIDEDVLAKWLMTSQTLQDWSRTFRLAKTTLEAESYATQADLSAQKGFMKSAQE